LEQAEGSATVKEDVKPGAQGGVPKETIIMILFGAEAFLFLVGGFIYSRLPEK
jgi:hypothetical protein